MTTKSKSICHLVVRSDHNAKVIADDVTFPVSQTGWHDALTLASEIARQNPSNLWVSKVELKCPKGHVSMYKCRREVTHRQVESTIPPFVHCELDVTRGSDRNIAGRRKKRKR